MSNKLTYTCLAILGLVCGATPAVAQTAEIGNIGAILADNSLRDAVILYTSDVVFFFPEEATRLGFSNANNRLNDRTAQTDAQALQAFRAIQDTLGKLDIQELSPSKQADYTLLAEALERHIWALQQDRLAHDPLYYAQALDAIYDLLLMTPDNSRKQRTDLLGRVDALPLVAQQAQQNLTEVSPQAAKLAMSKMYDAFVSFNTVAQRINAGAKQTNDPRDIASAATSIKKAKDAIRQLFELFKTFAQAETNEYDFRLGEPAYTQLLNNYYKITEKPNLLVKKIEQNFQTTQQTLAAALEPFELSADEEEITVVEDLNELPQVKQQTAPSKDNRKKTTYTPPTANQFYAVASQLVSPFERENLLGSFSNYTKGVLSGWVKDKFLPASLDVKMEPLTSYFSAQQRFLFAPAYGTFFLRLPQADQETLLNLDFSEPAYKTLVAQALVPGRYYQTLYAKSQVRKLLGSPTLSNGWTGYALQLAQEQNYFITDEEILFAAWQNYLYATYALVDMRLHYKQYDYAEALAFLTEENGFSQEQAYEMLAGIVAHPGEAVSYIIGKEMWQQAAAPYKRKFKDTGKVNALLLKTGNVSPTQLTEELKRLAQ